MDTTHALSCERCESMRRCRALAVAGRVESVTTVTTFVRTAPWNDPTTRFKVAIAVRGGDTGIGHGAEECEAFFNALHNAGIG